MLINNDVFKLGDTTALHPLSLRVLRYLTDIYQCTATLEVLKKQEQEQNIQKGYQDIIDFLNKLNLPTETDKNKILNEISDIKNSVLFYDNIIGDVINSIIMNFIEDGNNNTEEIGLSTLFEFISKWYSIEEDTSAEDIAIIQSELSELKYCLQQIVDNKLKIEKLQDIFYEYESLFTQAILSDLHINDYITYVGKCKHKDHTEDIDVYSLNLSSDITDLLRFTSEEIVLCPCRLSIPVDNKLKKEYEKQDLMSADSININVKKLNIVDREVEIEISTVNNTQKIDVIHNYIFDLVSYLYVYSSTNPEEFLTRLFKVLELSTK